MKAYYYDNKEGDQRLRHDSGREVSIPTLASLGVFYRHCPTIAQVDEVAIERKYGCRDEIFVSPKLLGDQYEPKMKTFFSEHLHEDEEIRHIKDGSGFFDVRDKNDEWIRIGLEAGDMVILPAGIYHRFTTDEKDYINAMRLFQTEPKWTPLNRAPELDANQCRVEYLKNRDAQVVA